jgi:hypothetical protein
VADRGAAMMKQAWILSIECLLRVGKIVSGEVSAKLSKFDIIISSGALVFISLCGLTGGLRSRCQQSPSISSFVHFS